MYEGWEADADVKADEFKDGWDAMQSQLAEDEAWAAHIYDVTYNHWENQ